jgi:hypothetical protein
VAIERKMEVSILTTRGPPRGFKARCRTGGAPSIEESGRLERQRANADPPSKRSPRPGGFTLQILLSRPMRTGGRWQRMTVPTRSAVERPPGFQPRPAARLVHPPRAEGAVLETDDVTAAHRLAGEPSAPAWFTFRTEPRIRTENLLILNQAPLPLG